MTDGEVTFQVEFNIDNDKNIEKLLQIRIFDFVLFSTSHITLVFLLESLSEKRVTGTDSSIPENLKKKNSFFVPCIQKKSDFHICQNSLKTKSVSKIFTQIFTWKITIFQE